MNHFQFSVGRRDQTSTHANDARRVGQQGVGGMIGVERHASEHR